MKEISIILLKGFLKEARKLLTEAELSSLVEYIAANPESGSVIQGSGGLRKMRWAFGNKGKSGGARVIYYYWKSEYEAYALDIYAKSNQENISKAQIKSLLKIIEVIKDGK